MLPLKNYNRSKRWKFYPENKILNEKISLFCFWASNTICLTLKNYNLLKSSKRWHYKNCLGWAIWPPPLPCIRHCCQHTTNKIAERLAPILLRLHDWISSWESDQSTIMRMRWVSKTTNPTWWTRTTLA